MGRSLRGTGTSCASERASAAGGCVKGRKICLDHLIVRFNCTVVFRRRAFVFSSPAHAAGALTFLRDQKSKQKSRRECDSPFPTSVGSENRTFPEQQSLLVLRYQSKKSGVLVNRRFFIDAIHQNRRLSRCLRVLRPGVCSDGVGAKPKECQLNRNGRLKIGSERFTRRRAGNPPSAH